MNNIYKIFGWNAKAFERPFLQAIKDVKLPNDGSGAKILEIGAGHLSAVSLFFANYDAQIEVSTYPQDKVAGVAKLVAEFGERKAPITTSCVSIFNIDGKYDLIIMKSVLGGVFRDEPKVVELTNQLLQRIVKNNLNPGGMLVTLDNGKTALARMYEKFGARCNKWHYYTCEEFQNYDRQFTFGFFSNFSLASRIGLIGHAFDNLLYYADLAICKLFKVKNTSVIVTRIRGYSVL